MVTGLNVAFMFAFTLLVPPYHGPDEGAHFDMIHQYERDPSLRRPDRRVRYVIRAGPIDAERRVLSPDVYGLRRPRLRIGDAPPREKRPTLAEVGVSKDATYNQMSQHPPLYYLIGAGVTRVVTVPDRVWSWDRELLLARLLSVVFVAPLALLASAAALAIRLPRGVGAIAAAFTLLVPQKSFLGAVVNNDTLVVLLAAVSVVAALRYLAGASQRAAWAAGAAAGALALTKSTGAVVTAWTIGVVAYGAYERWARGGRGPARRAFIGVGTFVALGSSWYVANVIRFHRAQPAPRRVIVHPVPTRFLTFLREFLDHMSRSFWGRPASRLGVELPWWVSHALSVLTIGAIVFAVVTLRSKRRYLLPLVTLCAVHEAVLLRTNWRANRMHSDDAPNVFSGLQGRYLFPLLVPLAVLVAAAFWSVLGRYPRAALIYAAAALVAIGTALHLALEESMLVGYWQGPSASFARHLRAVEVWSPLPTLLTVVVLALPFVVLAITCVPGLSWIRARRALATRSSQGA